MLVDWDAIGREKFDRVVEALIAYRYQDSEVTVFDGKGGDGGRDVVVVQGSRVRIFQLKYFPEGFSSANVKRRKQIEKSFKAALAHEPFQWTLVVPKNLTAGEQDYVRRLSDDSGVDVVDWWGQAQLDMRISGFPELVSYLYSDTAKEYLEAVGRRTALIEGRGDLEANLRDLRRAVDSADLHWTYDFAITAKGVVKTLRAKHPNAQNISPILLKFTPEGSPTEPTVHEKFTKMIDFGHSGEASLAVTHFTIEGPPLVAKRSEGGFVVLKSIDPDPAKIPVEFRFVDAAGSLVGSHVGFPTHVGEGRVGRSLTVELYAAIRIGMDLPHDADSSGTLHVDIDVSHADPYTILQVDRVLRSAANSHHLEIKVDGQKLVSLVTERKAWMSNEHEVGDWQYLVDLCHDLDYLTRETGSGFAVPENVEALDRVHVRCARLLLEGKPVVVPDHNTLNATVRLDGDLDWETILTGDGALKLEYATYGFELFGGEIQLGTAALVAAGYTVTDAASGELLERSDQLTDGMSVRIRPSSAKSWWTYLPERIASDAVIRPVPWGIEGFTEPPDVLATVGLGA